MPIWDVYGWTALVVADWLLVGHAVLWLRSDLKGTWKPPDSWLVPAATYDAGSSTGVGDETCPASPGPGSLTPIG